LTIRSAGSRPLITPSSFCSWRFRWPSSAASCSAGGSSGERRQQLKWLASGAAVTVVSVVIAVPLSTASPAGTAGAMVLEWVDNLIWCGLAALPVSMGVAILRYRLYEIDRIISRTLAYAAVTALLVGVYAGLVLLSTDVLSLTSSVAASTLAAAALFNPLRRRVQRVVDRRFNRAWYDAELTVAAFADRLKNAVDQYQGRRNSEGVWAP
jgi:hypothetical protein